ncbi:MAG TPA: tRNA pseudouridine(38-40) synthase TruA, partial [Blastocatellia bacterium]|nr:tRNA pseudouridine(38-40) synthase TruA [Blastocatellia bacterium]
QKTYRYHIFTGDVVSPFLHRYVYHYRAPLDIAALRRGAALLKGEHDFGSFAGGGSDVESTTRNVRELCIEQTDDSLLVTITANGFLRYMVRMLVGELIKVGRGQRSVADIADRLASSDYTLPRPTAPASGLTLMRVDY